MYLKYSCSAVREGCRPAAAQAQASDGGRGVERGAPERNLPRVSVQLQAEGTQNVCLKYKPVARCDWPFYFCGGARASIPPLECTAPPQNAAGHQWERQDVARAGAAGKALRALQPRAANLRARGCTPPPPAADRSSDIITRSHPTPAMLSLVPPAADDRRAWPQREKVQNHVSLPGSRACARCAAHRPGRVPSRAGASLDTCRRLNLVGEGKRRCVLSDMPGASR